MIEVRVATSRKEVCVIRMECLSTQQNGRFGDYSIQFAVDNGADELLLLQRSVESFPRKRFNALALLQLALDTLSEEEMYLAEEADIDHASSSPNLAGRLDRALRAL